MIDHDRLLNQLSNGWVQFKSSINVKNECLPTINLNVTRIMYHSVEEEGRRPD